MKKITLFAFILFLSLYTFSQNETGKYFIKTFNSKDFKHNPQIISVISDNRGVMYFGATNGILEFDGINWRPIDIQNTNSIFSLAKDKNGRIYYGGINEIGYLKSINTKVDYYSLTQQLDSSELTFGSVRNIIALDENIFFRTNKKLLIYNILTDSFTIKNPLKSFTFPFVYENEFYILDNQKIFKYQKDSLIEIENTRQFDVYVRGVYPYKNDSLMFITNDFFAVYKIGEPSHSLPLIDSYFQEIWKSSWVYSTTYSDFFKTFYLGTFDKGLLAFDFNLNPITVINTDDGLGDNFIWKMDFDKSNGLWLATEKGISRVEVPSTLNYWNETNDLPGTPYDAIRYKDKMYITTSQGVFKLNKNAVEKIEGIENQQCWQFFEFTTEKDTTLLVGTAIGVYKIENDKLILVSQGLHAHNFYRYSKNPNIVFVTWAETFSALEYVDNEFKTLDPIPDFNYYTYSPEEDKSGNMWLSAVSDGVIKITFNNDFTNPVEIKMYTTENGLVVNENNIIFNFNKDIYVSSNNKILKYVSEQDSFIETCFFNNDFCNSENALTFFTKYVDNKYIVTFTNDYATQYFLASINENNEWTFSENEFKKIPQMPVFNIRTEQNGMVWFCGSDGVYRYNPNEIQKFDYEHNALIRKVLINKDSIIYWGAGINSSGYKDTVIYPVFDFSNNSINFEFTSTDYQDFDNIYFSYFLEGYDKTWSSWEKDSKKEYTNLPEGEYIFRVKAKNLYNIESMEDTFSFEILPPWYRTWVAYFSYVILSILTVYIIIKLYTKRLVAQKLKLEQIVSERTAEISLQKEEIQAQNENLQHQKEEIQAQADELERINSELEKLSIVASETDNAVVIIDKNGNFEWVNEGFTRLYGYTFEDFVNNLGKNIFEVSSNENINNVQQFSLKKIFISFSCK